MESVEKLIACEKYLLAQRGRIRSAHVRRPTVELDEQQRAAFDSLAASVEGLL